MATGMGMPEWQTYRDRLIAGSDPVFVGWPRAVALPYGGGQMSVSHIG